MSYRELRNLCEISRALGYPRLLSIENFRNPNFKLVAEILEWIVKRFDPNSSINCQLIETEEDRIMYIKQAILLLLQNSRLKLNPKKLYQADGHAVQELLQAMKLLYDASKQTSGEDLNSQWNGIKQKINAKMQDVRIARQLSQQLPQSGAALYDLLNKELYYRKQRERATSRPISIADAEKTINQSIAAINSETQEIMGKLSNISNDEAVLDEKIERKKREIDQLQKRLAKLQTFRPQYMDEYERYETKLQQLYEEYVLKFRNLAYLKQVNSKMERESLEKQAESEKSMRREVERMRLEQINDTPIDAGDDIDIPPINHERLQPEKVFGNMTGIGISDDSDDDGNIYEDVEDVQSSDDEFKAAGRVVDGNGQIELSSGDEF